MKTKRPACRCITKRIRRIASAATAKRDIYRLVLVRIMSPGEFKIPDDQYLDKTYFSAEEKINYYFSHLLTQSAPNTKEERELASKTHTIPLLLMHCLVEIIQRLMKLCL